MIRLGTSQTLLLCAASVVTTVVVTPPSPASIMGGTLQLSAP
jgi:hypothetical protein